MPDAFAPLRAVASEPPPVVRAASLPPPWERSRRRLMAGTALAAVIAFSLGAGIARRARKPVDASPSVASQQPRAPEARPAPPPPAPIVLEPATAAPPTETSHGNEVRPEPIPEGALESPPPVRRAPAASQRRLRAPKRFRPDRI